MQTSVQLQLENDILKSRVLVLRFEIMLYAMPDYFSVYLDENMQRSEDSYLVTRNRKAYEYSDGSRARYGQLVSSTEMYNIIKRHLVYESQRLSKLEADYVEPLTSTDEEFTKLTGLLKELRDPPGPKTLLELQPRWVRRSDNEDDLYEEAASLVARTQIADVTLIRDNLSIGHTQASRLMEQLEGAGLVGRLENGANKRTVFVTIDDMNKMNDDAAE